jgi:hypothetical protein
MPLMYAQGREVYEPVHVYVLTTVPCIVCQREQREISVPASGLFKYHQGAFVQDAFPDMPPADREQLFMSGIGPNCFNKMFSEEER